MRFSRITGGSLQTTKQVFNFSFSDTSPRVLIFNFSGIITEIGVHIITAFQQGHQLSVGIPSNSNLLLPYSVNKSEKQGIYIINPAIEVDDNIILYTTESSYGSGLVYIIYALKE
jgi:hypothetical protein